MALESAFEPSIMNRRGTAGSSPRSIKLSISAWTTAECWVAPSISPSGCFVPSPSMPIAATSTISSAIWMPSICTTMMSRCQARPHPFLHARRRERHEAARGRRFRHAGALQSRNVAFRKSHRSTKLPRRDVDQHQVHRPPTQPILLAGPFPARQRQFLAVKIAHPRPLELHFAAMEADLAPGSTPAVTASPFASRVARPAGLLRILLQHGAQRLDPGGQAETLETRRHFLEGLTHRPARHGGRNRAKSLHGVAFLRGISTPRLPAQGEQRRSFYFNIRRDIPFL